MSTSNVEAVEVKKEDRRVRKTKRLLRGALTDLLKEKPIQEIKVREIADMVDINRGTFYQHYLFNLTCMYILKACYLLAITNARFNHRLFVFLII